MSNEELASLLRDIAVLSELGGADAWKARAYDAAARAVEKLPEPVAELAAQGRTAEIPGLGRGLQAVLSEAFAAGPSALRDELLAALPRGLPELLELPGLGPRRVRRLWQELGVVDLSSLERVCLDGTLLGLSGFGEGIRQRILSGLAFRSRSSGSCLLSTASAAASEAADLLRASGAFERVEPTGALRRGARVMDRVELLAVLREDAPPGAAESAVAALADPPGAPGPPADKGGRPFSREVRRSGVRVVVHAALPSRAAPELLLTTGAEGHLELLRSRARSLGLELSAAGPSRDGLPLDARTEPELYAALGLEWIPPELREGGDELEAALSRRLPRLVERAHLRGLIHAHTTASDGLLSLPALAEACAERGYEYLCVSDHSRSAAYAGGLSLERLREQHAEARELDRRIRPFRVFHGVEADILADGRLDYPDEVLAELDFVIGSVHSGMAMAPEKATARLLAAVASPFLTVLGHPSGALLLEREGYRYDEERLLEALAAHDVALEHNCDPSRLDPDWPLLRKARQAGVALLLCPDAHDASGLDNVRWGVVMARKAWLEPRDLLNCLRADELEARFLERRRRANRFRGRIL